MDSERKKKVRKKYRTNPRNNLYLLDKPICNLPANKLPTRGHVIRYLEYLKSPMSQKFKSTKFHAGCELGTKSSKLKCKNSVCAGEKRCATSAVIDIWTAAGFDSYIKTGGTIKKQIIALHKKYTLLLDRSRKHISPKFSKEEEIFREESNKLFDISVPDFETKI